MQVLLAPSAFAGTLTAAQAADTLATGWRRGAPHDEVRTLPLSDGGLGFADVLARSLPGTRSLPVTVTGPVGARVASVVVLDEDGTAYVDAATAAGAHLMSDPAGQLETATSRGVGELVLAAAAAGARRVVVGVRDLGCHDGGAGLLAALAPGALPALGHGPLPLAEVTAADLAGIEECRQPLRGVELVLATDVEEPLLGLGGATAMKAADGALPPGLAAAVESALGHFAERVRRVVPERVDLVTGTPLRPDRLAGSGAGGGVGYALHLLGATRVGGAHCVAAAVGLGGAVQESDLVVTGEGCLDWRSLHAGVVPGVAAAALETGTPAVAVVGSTMVGRRESQALGLSAVYAVAETSAQVRASMADPVESLAARTAAVARTWSPYR